MTVLGYEPCERLPIVRTSLITDILMLRDLLRPNSSGELLVVNHPVRKLGLQFSSIKLEFESSELLIDRGVIQIGQTKDERADRFWQKPG